MAKATAKPSGQNTNDTAGRTKKGISDGDKTLFPSRHDGFYRAFSKSCKDAIKERGYPTITEYIGALLSMPNHAESDFSEGILTQGMEAWEDEQPEVVAAAREFARTCIVAKGPRLSPANTADPKKHLRLVIMKREDAQDLGAIAAPRKRARPSKRGNKGKGQAAVEEEEEEEEQSAVEEEEEQAAIEKDEEQAAVEEDEANDAEHEVDGSAKEHSEKAKKPESEKVKKPESEKVKKPEREKVEKLSAAEMKALEEKIRANALGRTTKIQALEDPTQEIVKDAAGENGSEKRQGSSSDDAPDPKRQRKEANLLSEAT